MLKINLEFRKGILFVRLRGELTRFTSKSLKDYLIPTINNQGIKYLVFNLSNINIIDNYGKDTLKSIINTLNKNNGKGLICNTKIKLDENFKLIDNELMAFNTLKI